MRAPHVVFSNTTYGSDYGKVEVAAGADPDDPRAVTPLSCARVDVTAGAGICLSVDQGIVTTYSGKIFDDNFDVQHTFPLPGRPSRARMSPDGHYAAMTVFVYGDSYAASTYSTRTIFVDARTGEILGHLEEFDVTNNGKSVDAINRNYWGVTFAADSNTFYATLGVGDDIKLIEGDLAARTAHVVRDDVECPSLSPDGTRLAFKHRIGGGLQAIGWRIHVLDLAKGTEIEVAETRSVDDQVEWRDDKTVLYALPSDTGGRAYDTWAAPADGSGAPTLMVQGASSPSMAPAAG